MSRIKQRQVLPSVDRQRSAAVKVYTTEAIAENDLLTVDGMHGSFMSVSKASAAATTTAGKLFIADFAAAAGQHVAVAIPWKVVGSVNTSSDDVGDVVYLSDTAGSISSSAGTVTRAVGYVVEVATSGTVIISV